MATGRIFRALTGAALLTFFTLGTGVYDEPTLHRGSGDRHAEFVRHTGTILVVTPVIVTEVDDAISCSFACLSYAGCFSYNVRATPDPKGRFACDLLATDKYNASGDFRPSSISDHYSIKVWREFFYRMSVQIATSCLQASLQNVKSFSV